VVQPQPEAPVLVDTSKDATLTIPEMPQGRYFSVLIVDSDHYAPEVIYTPGTPKLPQNTKYISLLLRIRVNAEDPADIAFVNKLEDQFVISAGSADPFPEPTWDRKSLEDATAKYNGAYKLPDVVQTIMRLYRHVSFWPLANMQSNFEIAEIYSTSTLRGGFLASLPDRSTLARQHLDLTKLRDNLLRTRSFLAHLRMSFHAGYLNQPGSRKPGQVSRPPHPHSAKQRDTAPGQASHTGSYLFWCNRQMTYLDYSCIFQPDQFIMGDAPRSNQNNQPLNLRGDKSGSKVPCLFGQTWIDLKEHVLNPSTHFAVENIEHAHDDIVMTCLRPYLLQQRVRSRAFVLRYHVTNGILIHLQFIDYIFG